MCMCWEHVGGCAYVDVRMCVRVHVGSTWVPAHTFMCVYARMRVLVACGWPCVYFLRILIKHVYVYIHVGSMRVVARMLMCVCVYNSKGGGSVWAAAHMFMRECLLICIYMCC